MGSGSWAETHTAVSCYQGRIPSVGQTHYVSRLHRSKCMCHQHQRTHPADVSVIDQRRTDRECFHFPTPERTYVPTPRGHYRNRFRNDNRYLQHKAEQSSELNPLNPELNPICYLLALLGAYHFLRVSRIRVKLLTFRLLMSYTYEAPILDVSRSHTTTQHSR